jgi:hypothetical protein
VSPRLSHEENEKQETDMSQSKKMKELVIEVDTQPVLLTIGNSSLEESTKLVKASHEL